jgi:hypothetical protein
MKTWKLAVVSIVAVLVLGKIGVSLLADNQASKKAAKQEAKEEKEQEREVKESEVPDAALQTLKQQAAGAPITEFAEEKEHGSTFYEGSWKSPTGGNIDVLVTEMGDLVEIEESTGGDQVPAAVMEAARKAAGQESDLHFEKKTTVSYEVKFRKAGKRQELVLTPDGRRESLETDDGEEGDKEKD